MLTDKQSLLFCGLIIMVIFVAGMLNVLDNFIVLTMLSIGFLAIIVNLILGKNPKGQKNQEPTE